MVSRIRVHSARATALRAALTVRVRRVVVVVNLLGVVVVVGRGVEVVVVGLLDVVVVVVRSVGPAISVVETGTLVVNEFEVSDGVMISGAPPLPVVVTGAGATPVVNTVGAGLVQSAENCTMAYTRAASSTAPRPPAATVAAVVRYQG